MSETLERVTVAAPVESQKLQRHFGRFDILFFLICTIVGVDTIASVASSGGEGFPQEGGPYYWTRLAFGHLVGAVNNFLYWITNPVWIGGTLAGACVGAIQVFFNHGDNLSTPLFYVVAMIFVWTSVLAAIMSFSKAKWLPTAGAFARFLLLGLFTVSIVIYAAKHGFHGLDAGSYKPSYAGFVA